LDLKVLQQKIGRVGVVGVDATHLRSCEQQHRGLVLGEPLVHRHRIKQIELSAARGELLVIAGAVQGAADGAAGHAPNAEDRDAVIGGDQGGHGWKESKRAIRRQQTGTPAKLGRAGIRHHP